MLRRRKPLRRIGKRAVAWKEFRNAKFARDANAGGRIRCNACVILQDNPDLHHTKGRSGNLLLDERHMVWLCRLCHNKAHETNNKRTSPKQEEQQADYMQE